MSAKSPCPTSLLPCRALSLSLDPPPEPPILTRNCSSSLSNRLTRKTRPLPPRTVLRRVQARSALAETNCHFFFRPRIRPPLPLRPLSKKEKKIVIVIVVVTSTNKSWVLRWPSLLRPSLKPPVRLSELLSGTFTELKTEKCASVLYKDRAITHPRGSVKRNPNHLTAIGTHY